ncbi:beta-galactosidase [Aerococcaceae bacterium zg-BR22]|uniref:beta-galactosidase n=1 Tax=Aerococcaceae bacterium zg-1292 TaxID=2774330 RepID=UPI004063429A|nr:beta-galactosidase [Aerococcaceae bacterium zg-BR22]
MTTTKEAIMKDYYYGAAMYPEVIEEKTFINDIRHMKAIGMNVVRIGEFFWSKLEPQENSYCMKYLMNILNILQSENMNVILGIPTATPPRWLTIKYPDSVMQNIDGTIMDHGSRQHVCTNHSYYREKCYQLTEKIAQVVPKYDNIIAIQLDNEFKCHVNLCYCSQCQKQWQTYLREQYTSIKQLNNNWGNAIWSQEYRHFDEIPTPKKTPFLHNSSLQNSFREFTAEKINEFARELTKIIKSYSNIPVTHNSALGFNLMNESLFEPMDIAGFDTYAGAENYPAYTMNLDLWRNIKETGHNESLLLETSTSHAGHIENYVSPHPQNYLQTEIFTGFASGLKAFCYWHFRGHAFGVEQPHSAVVNAWGEPDIGYEDVVQSGALLTKILPYISTTELVTPPVAIVYSDESRRFYEIESGGRYQYRKLITDFYSYFIKNGITVDLITESNDFSQYRIIYLPFIRHIDKDLIEKLKNFSSLGGRIILGPMTGDRTKNLGLSTENGLGILGEWLELKEVKQFYLSSFEQLPVSGLINTFTAPKEWESLLSVKNMTTWAKNENIYILGAFDRDYKSDEWCKLLLETSKYDSGVYSDILLSKGIKLYIREDKDSYYYFLANMTNEPAKYRVNLKMKNVFSNCESNQGNYLLRAFESLVLIRNK